MAGFSPITYMPAISPRSIAPMISTTVRPGLGSSVAPHSASSRSRVVRLPVGW
jgi:hypothetical protein